MSSPIIAILVILFILVFVEILWRTHTVRGELSRKLIHILVGTFIAFWPFFMPFSDIQKISIALLIVIILSWRFSIFEGIHKVNRRTYGELFYPIGIGLSATLTHDKWVFAAAILHMSLADGLATIIGLRYGKTNNYKVYGQVKSIAGTLTFFVVSALITLWFLYATPQNWPMSTYAVVVFLPLTATFIENIAPLGSDNFFVPMFVIGVLGSLQRLF